MKVFLGMVLIACCTLSHAASREENTKRLIAAQGIVDMFAQQKAQTSLAAKHQSEDMFQQITSGFNINDNLKEKLYKSSNQLVSDLQSSSTPEEMGKIWADLYTVKFTDSELEELVKYSESPLGQKERQVSQQALSEFTAHFIQLNKIRYEKATSAYITAVKQALAECNCKKAK